MTTLESILLSYLVNALWQVPLVLAAGWLAARALCPLGPAVEHRVWVGVLMLQVLLPAASIVPMDALRTLVNLVGSPLHNGQPHVSVVMGPVTAFGNPHLPAWILTAIAIVYIAITLWFTARFAWRVQAVRLLGQNAVEPGYSADIEEYWARYAKLFGVKAACLRTSSRVFGPVTIGIWRKSVLLPPGMLASLPEAELRTAIAHEFAHMQRRDFLKNLLYELLSLPVRFHPIVSVTRNRLTETREMACDRLAANLTNQHQYARSLLRLASLLVNEMPVSTPHTIGIFDATSFERRVMRLTQKPASPSVLRRLTTATACILLGAGICTTTLALSIHVDALAASEEQRPSEKTGPVTVSAGIMAGQLVNKVTPTYPDEAKKERIQGKIELEAIINKAGEVENLRVVSGPKELQQSALDAVRRWTYKPFLLNGEPVEVKTTINVTYSLSK
jgi:TonB family protein